MSGIFDYLKWRGDIPVSRVTLGDADRLILAELAYMELSADTPKPLCSVCQSAVKKLDVIRKSGAREKFLHHKQDERLLGELSASERYSELLIGHCKTKFSKSSEEQFGAMTVILPDGSIAVIFRGTDWSLVGWKEDINMAFADELPAQRSAVDYLDRMGKLYKGSISVFGHSKGGNLAVYASAFCSPEVQNRITDVTSLDGPGFAERVITSAGYKAVSDRITTFMPRASIVAAFFSNSGRFNVVKSRTSGLLQHITYNWEIMGGGFVTAERDITTQHINNALNEWILSLTVEQRRQFIDILWSVVTDSNVNELGDIIDAKKTLAIIKNYNALDEASRKTVEETLNKLNTLAKGYLREILLKASK